MSLVSTIRDLGQKLRAATATITESIASARAEIAAKQHALGHAQRGPRPPAEVMEQFNVWVDAMTAHQAKEYGLGLVTLRFGAAPGADHGGSPWTPNAEMTWGFACLFLGAELKRRFAELVKSVPYEAGPAEADRLGVIERLTRELAAADAREEALIDEAAAAGVVIAHRPEVVERRTQEARRRELAERAEADRKEREAALNRRHTERGGPVPSPYLERERARP
jgi:hypothetical protein